MKTAELKVLQISLLKPAEYNPRKKLKPGDAEYEKIKSSIEEFGFADPLVVNSDMTIIGGHQRLTVAQNLGYTEVPCAVVDIDKVREKALNIALNKITGAWDENLLADLLQDIQNSDFDLGKTGFDPPEIETLFNKVHSKDVQEDECFRRILEDRPTNLPEVMVDGHVGFLYRDKKGMPEVAMHWEHRFNHAVKRYNNIFKVQMPNITPHICRHTYCSNMAKSGINPKTLQYLMGCCSSSGRAFSTDRSGAKTIARSV